MLANCSGLFASKAINRERSSLNALISQALGFACCRILAAMNNSRPTDESKQVKETRLTFVFAPFSWVFLFLRASKSKVEIKSRDWNGNGCLVANATSLNGSVKLQISSPVVCFVSIFVTRFFRDPFVAVCRSASDNAPKWFFIRNTTFYFSLSVGRHKFIILVVCIVVSFHHRRGFYEKELTKMRHKRHTQISPPQTQHKYNKINITRIRVHSAWST